MRSYERTSEAQKKHVSEILGSGQSTSRVALQVVNTAVVGTNMPSSQGAAGKENQVTLQHIQNCTLNFHFN